MSSKAIDLYMWATPNGYKISIMLEEVHLPYRVIPVDIGKGEQFEPKFLHISPNNKIPAIIDPDGPDGARMSLFESGAILIYLAEKSGRMLPNDACGRAQTMQWLMFQMGGVGPMLGQAHHFRHYAKEHIAYAVDRYTNEAARLYGVMDRRLGEAEFLAGAAYSIADIATFPWVRRHERHGQNLDDFPHVRRWYRTIAARPAVTAGLLPLSEGKSVGSWRTRHLTICCSAGPPDRRARPQQRAGSATRWLSNALGSRSHTPLHERRPRVSRATPWGERDATEPVAARNLPRGLPQGDRGA